MKFLTSNEIRNTWLKFFKERGHMVEPGASLVPANDSTLLWINSGVAALKKYFDGSEIPSSRRITNVQKSIRTNDIENVGKTARHHTFFEMLGNFSIGDYFRNEVIPWAFEILTSEKYYGLDVEKLYITYNPDDLETRKLWLNCGVKDDHLIALEGNFWQIGEGPCGPNTEVFYDRGSKYDPENLGIRLLKEEIENDRYIEIWGIVFSQYNAVNGVDRKDYKELPSKNIDTGAGLERICCVIQGTETNFETDLFMPIIRKIEELSKTKYSDNKTAFRVISDHIRTCVFAISDGAMFSNEGRGYVLRRLLRRAMRYGRQIGFERPFLYKLVDIVIDNMKDFYPYLDTKREFLKNAIKVEEEKFLTTLNSGESTLNELIKKNHSISGSDAFKLYDTYGFPYELTNEIALEHGIEINKEEFDKLMNEQKERARNSRNVVESMNKQSKDLLEFKKQSFFDYDSICLNAKVIGLFKDGISVKLIKDEGFAVFSKTPFYAEMGGQIYDIGTFKTASSSGKIISVSTTPNKQNIHKIIVETGVLNLDDEIILSVDYIRRGNVESNHSATHLLHKALKETLGCEIAQKGSFVNEDYLRFDFGYDKKLTNDQLNSIEKLVNTYINLAIDEKTLILSYEDAIKIGAEHEFEEKYGDSVRVVTFGEISKEFCGGTHVKNTKDIGIFMISSEESISSGVRRIEATTGFNAYKNIKVLQERFNNINSLLNSKSTIEAIDKLKALIEEKINISKKNGILMEKVSTLEARNVLGSATKVLDKNVIVAQLKDADRETLLKIVDFLKTKLDRYVLVMVGKAQENGYPIILAASKDIAINCNLILKEITAKFGGSGGGRPDFVNGLIKSIDKNEISLILKEHLSK